MPIDLNKVLTSVVTAVVLYIGATVYQLDKDVALIKYQMNQNNSVLQMLSEK